jgi:hypothetical protein
MIPGKGVVLCTEGLGSPGRPPGAGPLPALSSNELALFIEGNCFLLGHCNFLCPREGDEEMMSEQVLPTQTVSFDNARLRTYWLKPPLTYR